MRAVSFFFSFHYKRKEDAIIEIRNSHVRKIVQVSYLYESLVVEIQSFVEKRICREFLPLNTETNCFLCHPHRRLFRRECFRYQVKNRRREHFVIFLPCAPCNVFRFPFLWASNRIFIIHYIFSSVSFNGWGKISMDMGIIFTQEDQSHDSLRSTFLVSLKVCRC